MAWATPDSRSAAIAGAARNAAVIASTKLNMNATRMRICETPIWISSSDVSPSRGPATRAAPRRRRQRDADQGQARPGPTRIRRRAASAIVSARRCVTGSPITAGRVRAADDVQERSSSVVRDPSTACTRPPAADDRRHNVGDDRRLDGRDREPAVGSDDRAEPSQAFERRCRQVGHADPQPGSPSRSSSRPLASTRPWSTIATRSQTRSTSLRRCELRKTVEPASRARRDDRADVERARPGRVPRSARRGRPGRARRAARPPARAAAACPSRSCRPDRRRGRRGRHRRGCAVDVRRRQAPAAPPSRAMSRACSSSTSRARSHGW